MTHTYLNNLAFFLDLLIELNSTSFLTSPSLKSLSALWDLFNSNYRNPSFGLATKAKGIARVRAKGKPGS